ncbi:Bug family tripartite tricarboxylate transporter substrate binding protein [Comamonas testosteroni]|uniref:Bug family tripartite tricarboxylate transporter substrate binding protein n=2 Tax=Comamonas testosteroni TaxID=285 RepID=UPI0005B43E64|nr:tripartite tricarboxylate transporter substrate binding protein [Comamonas testosteroni]
MHQLPGRPDSFFTGAKTPACALPSRRQVLGLGATALAAGLMLTSGATAAAGFPERAVTVVVPYSPAGGVDIVTRLVTTPMAEFLGQSIVVENKPGGGTNIGMATVARSAPNGYTLLTASNTLTTNKALYSKLGFDPATDLIPVGRIGEAPLVVVVNAKSPYKSLAELIAAGKAKPGALSYGTAGVGSSGHMASALLEKAGQFKGVHVPYKGGSTAVTDLLGGRLDFMAINPLEVAGHVNSGSLRALAVLNKNGSRLLPQVPTARSLGVDVQATVWWGLVAPKGTPEAVIQTLNAALNKALTTPAVTQTLADMGATPLGGTPAQFGSFIQAETRELGEVIRAADIRAD